MSSDDASALIAVLLGRATLQGVVPEAVLEYVEDQIGAIRGGTPVVEWFGVNDGRVDVIVNTTGDQWRIVYFTCDGATVDSLSVFRRPVRFHGVADGRAVLVNGASGAGKSSLLTAIAEASDVPWVLFDEPVIGTVDQAYLIWRDQAPVLHRGFLDAIAAVARRGNFVGVAAAGHPAAVLDDAFDGVPTLRVGLDCDAATLAARELGREGRWGGIAAASMSVHDGWSYDVRFDTSHLSATVIAQHVLELVDELRGSTRGDR